MVSSIIYPLPLCTTLKAVILMLNVGQSLRNLNPHTQLTIYFAMCVSKYAYCIIVNSFRLQIFEKKMKLRQM